MITTLPLDSTRGSVAHSLRLVIRVVHLPCRSSMGIDPTGRCGTAPVACKCPARVVGGGSSFGTRFTVLCRPTCARAEESKISIVEILDKDLFGDTVVFGDESEFSPWIAGLKDPSGPGVAGIPNSGSPPDEECRRGDLNPHALAGASPSSWCVCLFRHFDVVG